MRVLPALFACAALAGCSALPRDVEGTTDHVRTSKVLRVGYARDVKRWIGSGQLVERLERNTGARASFVEGESEPLLTKLEAGQLDLVLATFDPKSPWKTRVALAPPLFKGWDLSPERERLELRAAARNGENRWIMLVETTSRAITAEGGR